MTIPRGTIMLQSRLFVSRESSVLPVLTDSSRTHYGMWSDESMVKAMSAVEQGVSVRRASELYGVPRSTLHDRISGRVISQYDFSSSLFAKAWKAAMTPGNITSSFAVTGIYPFNPEKILSKIDGYGPKQQQAFTPQSLAYIPLYSPAPTSLTAIDDSMNCSIETLNRSLSDNDLHLSSTPMQHRATSSVSRRFSITPKKLKSTNVSAEKVLTSIENLREIEEKEKVKAQALKDKEDRKAKREAKKVEKALKANAKAIKFSEEEIQLFEKCYENGYDLMNDPKYNLWLSVYHPKDSEKKSSSSVLVTKEHVVNTRRGTKGSSAPTLEPTVDVESSMEEDCNCDATTCIIDESGLLNPVWICCMTCERWFHLFCIDMTVSPVDEYFCDLCA